MSIHAIHKYHQELERIIHFGGTKKETSIRVAFQNLLNEYSKQKDLILIPEITIKTAAGNNVMPDGTLKDMLRLDWGYWESKDEDDDLDEEIKKKFDKGYPKDNILFEDSQTAVLIQGGKEKKRVKMANAEALDKLLHDFVNFERPEVKQFRTAIELFKQDIPQVVNTLRDIILAEGKSNKAFIKSRKKFLKLCQNSINPEVNVEDVREMIIQHILTEDIFNTIFDETQFHRENNIAHELELVVNTFFKGEVKRKAFGSISHYYKAINAAAAGIADHHEKQNFLKVVYETFYKSYNPKAADRLGVVYTPNEIVKFMVESTDYLLHKHFNKYLEDENVHILDPATGTGTFICDIIDHIRKEKLEHKYRHELHSNELAILPYYISNLNIEFTYNQKMGNYVEFKNHCFVDTLDNMGFEFRGKQLDIFDAFSEENSQRVHRQNEKPISVVIGNPPYNAKQENYNYQNANRTYLEIDKRIKDTFIKYGTAQNQIVVYDMYTRFYRWAMDRLDDKGVICFITNSSFVDGRAFDGFRKCIQDEFQFVYIIDLGGNIRTLSGKDGIFLNEENTIFGVAAAVGIAMMFLVKDKSRSKERCEVRYIHPTDIRAKRSEKLEYLAEHKFSDIPFQHIRPTEKNNWINLTDNDFDDLIPLIDKNVKSGKSKKALFKLFSRGVATQRDEWVYDFSKIEHEKKVRFMIDVYQKTLEDQKFKDKMTIKWDRELQKYLERGIEKEFDTKSAMSSIYRPFVKKQFYFDKHFNGMTYQWFDIFREGKDIRSIAISGIGFSQPYRVLASNTIIGLDTMEKTQCLPIHRFNSEGNQTENITDWGLNKFTRHYKTKKITKEEIFNYVYAVLHNPTYRAKYELNLKREFPRIPFYEDFYKWSLWGKTLMDLHINYESATPFGLSETTDTSVKNPKAKLKSDQAKGQIILDEATTLSGIPASAWRYKLGNRSALEWILDQYKEKKPRDPTIVAKFNTYKFADYKQDVIELLKRVCTVSVETVEIVEEMEKIKE